MTKKEEKTKKSKEEKGLKVSLPFGGKKENKKETPGSSKKHKGKKANPIKKGLSYFVESKEELKKVTWPTRNETVKYSIIVIIISIIVAAFLGTADFFLSKGLNYLLNITFKATIDKVIIFTYYNE